MTKEIIDGSITAETELMESAASVVLIGGPSIRNYSRSPGMWNEVFKLLKLRERYEARGFSTDDEIIAEINKSTKRTEYKGGNITNPFKEIVFQSLLDGVFDVQSTVDESAMRAGSANTLAYRNGALTGFNTDGFGEVKSLERMVPNLTELSVLVIGAGGAAMGVVPALLEAGVKRIDIANRTVAKAEAVKDRMKKYYPLGEVGVFPEADIPEMAASGKYSLILNTTTKGQPKTEGAHLSPLAPGKESEKENIEQTLKVLGELKRKNPEAVLADLIYSPESILFLTLGKQQGFNILDGRGMLVHQGARAFQKIIGENLLPYEELAETMNRGFDSPINPQQ
jgi:shikimate dehydrogenase